MADKDKDGSISQLELAPVISKYRDYLKAQPDIMKLIQKFDSNRDRILDSAEMQALLKVNRVIKRHDLDPSQASVQRPKAHQSRCPSHSSCQRP